MNIKLLALVVGTVFIFNFCCIHKGPYPEAGVNVKYVNISSPKMMKAILTDRSNLSKILDTITLGELNEYNKYKCFP